MRPNLRRHRVEIKRASAQLDIFDNRLRMNCYFINELLFHQLRSSRISVGRVGAAALRGGCRKLGTVTLFLSAPGEKCSLPRSRLLYFEIWIRRTSRQRDG
jgi:hypothetical protein